MKTIDFFKLEHFSQLKVSTELFITKNDVDHHSSPKNILLHSITRNIATERL